MVSTSTNAADGDVGDATRWPTPADTGLSDAPDDGMDFVARWVRRALRVPLAAVSLIQADRQVLPGLSTDPGTPSLPRSVSAAWSMTRLLVESAATPVAIADTRLDPRTRAHPAIGMGVIAYAAVPLRDGDGRTLGALVAVDHTARNWDDTELTTLGELARVCETDLRLRLARRDATRETDRHDLVEDAQRRALDRSQMLLAASQAFTDTETLDDVRDRIDELLLDELQPSFIAVVSLDRRGRGRRLGPDRSTGGQPPERAALIEAVRSDLAAGRHGVQHHPDRDSVDRHYPHAGAHLRELGLHCLVSAPLPAQAGPLGAIVLGWDTPHAVSPTDLLSVTTIAGFAAQALTRARLLDHRTVVAREMQHAMLTTLPTTLGLPMAARYAPADARDHVGGDWYDAVTVTDPGHPDDHVLALSVGDIVGHSLPAVTTMGQVRSMLRQATYDLPGHAPSSVLDAFEHANGALQLGATGTMISAHLRPSTSGHCTLTWVNAGHPPPVLLLPDGGAELLRDHDPLFGFGLTEPGGRVDHHRDLPPGAVLFLYTDGLIEKRGRDIDEGTELLLTHLRRVRDEPPERIVDSAVNALAPHSTDDVVAFAIRVPYRPRHPRSRATARRRHAGDRGAAAHDRTRQPGVITTFSAWLAAAFLNTS